MHLQHAMHNFPCRWIRLQQTYKRNSITSNIYIEWVAGYLTSTRLLDTLSCEINNGSLLKYLLIYTPIITSTVPYHHQLSMSVNIIIVVVIQVNEYLHLQQTTLARVALLLLQDFQYQFFIPIILPQSFAF